MNGEPRIVFVTVSAICMCGTKWTSSHWDRRGARTVRIPTCPACTPDTGTETDQ